MPEAGELREVLNKIQDDASLALSYAYPGVSPEEREELKQVARKMRYEAKRFAHLVGADRYGR